MKGTSKVIMGATLAMVVTLVIVLALVLVLLAELYCSLLLRRRQLRITSNTTTTTTSATITTTSTTNTSLSESPQPQNQSPSLSPSSYYSQGVLQAPRNYLFPAVPSNKENKVVEAINEHSQLHHFLEVHTEESNKNLSPQQIGLRNTSPPSTAFVSSTHQIQEIPIQIRSSDACNDKECAGCGEHFVYISNPIYDNDASRPTGLETPYETPDSSPSRLEIGGSSSGEEETTLPSPSTPPLTPMKKLPAEACSVSLKDTRSLGTSGSDSVSNNGLSSSSSGSPCTSPSW